MKRRIMVFVPLGILVVLVACFTFILLNPQPHQVIRLTGDIRTDRPMADFTLPELDKPDQQHGARDFLSPGTLTIINFFASWCQPCLLEHKELVVLSQNPKIRLIGIAWHDRANATRAFLDRQGNPFATVLEDNNGTASVSWGLSGVPETFLINDQGKLIGHVVGPVTPEIRAQQIMPMVPQ